MARYRFSVRRRGDPDWYMRGWRASMDPRLRVAGEWQFGTPLLVMLGTLLNGDYIGLVVIPILAWIFKGGFAYRFHQNRTAWWMAVMLTTGLWVFTAIGLVFEART